MPRWPKCEINAAGGVLGHKVALVTGDTSCDVADGVTATNQMLTKHVSGVIGPETQEINGVEPILDAQHIVDEFQGGDTARDHQKDPYFFRDSPSDSQLGVAMALYAHTHGYSKAVMLFYSDPAAQTFLKPVSQTFTKLGGTILKTIIVTPDQTSYLSQVRSVIAAHPQVIFTQEDPPTAAVLFREFKQLGGQNIPWIGTDVTSGSDYLKAIGYPDRPRPPDLGVRHLDHRGRELRVHQPVQHVFPSQKAAGPLANANYAYDAVISLALADDYAKTTSGTTVAQDMTKVTNPPGTPCYTYSSCLAAEGRDEDQLSGSQREPRLQPVQQHVRALRRLPVHPLWPREAGLRDVGGRAGGGDAVASAGPFAPPSHSGAKGGRVSVGAAPWRREPRYGMPGRKCVAPGRPDRGLRTGSWPVTSGRPSRSAVIGAEWWTPGCAAVSAAITAPRSPT